MPPQPAFDYVAVGHVTVDVLADGSRRPGGGAFYSGLQAARLGLRTLIVTKGEPHELHELLAPFASEFELEIKPSLQTTTFETHGDGRSRRQRVLAWAGTMAEPLEVDTAILHLAAVARETPTHWLGRADFVGLTPQGLVRQWDGAGTLELETLQREQLPHCFDAVVISELERPACEWLLAAPARPERSLVAVTAGAHPVAVYAHSGVACYPAARSLDLPTDDLGAGDVFAAALFVGLAEGAATEAAVAQANAAAAVRLAGLGADAIGDRAALVGELSRD